ncbi:hypothetical protein [Acidipropionibacterium virtanenii]|uniref:Uncharacterized protein n=1 Tax=Acidipropionibacterium virtanenii TaxID=2057246 RepID=A0A344UWQ0_9ACTN|nr:hypothetical protein [Acidipropionibacterium virtanenii]AXE39698.1 hypothetical protein JS278_02560 [Acidipropionibacterium virtanenii]
MVSILTTLLGVFLGILATLTLDFLKPLRHRLSSKGIDSLKVPPVTVVSETDLDVIYAGHPDWIATRYWIARLPTDLPHGGRGAYRHWVISQGGFDKGYSVVMVNIVAESDATVVIRPPLIDVTSVVSLEEPGVELVRTVGGAETRPRAFEVHLDSHPEVVKLVAGDDRDATLTYTWNMRRGDVETFLIRVMVHAPGVWKWRARVPALTNGRMHYFEVNDDGHDFTTVGSDTKVSSEWVRDESGWVRRGSER